MSLKKFLPFGFAIVPGGFALAISLYNAQKVYEAGVATQKHLELIDAVSQINGRQLNDASYFADKDANRIATEFMNSTPNVTQEQVNEVYYQAYAESKAERLGLTDEQYDIIADRLSELEEVNNNQWTQDMLDKFWTHQGYESNWDANEALTPLIELVQNGDPESLKVLNSLNIQWSDLSTEMFVLEELEKELIDIDASSFTTDTGFVAGAMDALAANPELGAMAAAATVGAVGVGYFAGKYFAGKDSQQSR